MDEALKSAHAVASFRPTADLCLPIADATVPICVDRRFVTIARQSELRLTSTNVRMSVTKIDAEVLNNHERQYAEIIRRCILGCGRRQVP